jgi:hypothetical protein
MQIQIRRDAILPVKSRKLPASRFRSATFNLDEIRREMKEESGSK